MYLDQAVHSGNHQQKENLGHVGPGRGRGGPMAEWELEAGGPKTEGGMKAGARELRAACR